MDSYNNNNNNKNNCFSFFVETNDDDTEMKVLKQRVRNIIDPNRSLGHSDGKSSRDQKQVSVPATVAVEDTRPPERTEDPGGKVGEQGGAYCPLE